MDVDDEVVYSLPIRFSDRLSLQIHQFPLLTRPLQPPPSAVTSGKRVKARIKPGVHRLEVHVPADTRPDVWNTDRGKELGAARVEDDREKNQSSAVKDEKDPPRLSEVRLLSEAVHQNGAHMLGIVRNGAIHSLATLALINKYPGELHLHPVKETHQFRPTLTYLDYLTNKHRRRGGGGDSDSEDDEPPPDPDEPSSVTPQKPAKKARAPGETKEVHVTARKAVDDKGGMQALGGMTQSRRDMLAAIRAEEDEDWQDLQYNDMEVGILSCLVTAAHGFIEHRSGRRL